MERKNDDDGTDFEDLMKAKKSLLMIMIKMKKMIKIKREIEHAQTDLWHVQFSTCQQLKNLWITFMLAIGETWGQDSEVGHGAETCQSLTSLHVITH